MTNTIAGSTPATLTLERFAALCTRWVDTIAVTGGVLLARIHPRNNRPYGDEEVLARALVFIPPRTYPAIHGFCEEDRDEGHLARLTIRTQSLTGPFPEEYIALLLVVLELPVIELAARPTDTIADLIDLATYTKDQS